MTKVIVYTTTSCPYCQMEKNYLTAKGVSFENKLLDYDQKAVEEILKLSNQLAVPFTVVEKEDRKYKILGFDKAKLDKILNLN